MCIVVSVSWEEIHDETVGRELAMFRLKVSTANAPAIALPTSESDRFLARHAPFPGSSCVQSVTYRQLAPRS